MNGVYTQSQDSGILQKNKKQKEEYVVAYAKITESKTDGICLEGVFFGGVGITAEDAEDIARNCVNSVRGGTIIPKILPVNGKCQVIDVLYDAIENFEKITNQMIEAHKTIQRTQGRKKR